MIEKFTPEEIQILIKELKEYDVKNCTKTRLMKEEAVKVFGGDPFICGELGKCFYGIADFMTENYKQKGNRKYCRRDVPEEIEAEYRTIINGLLRIARPSYGSLGFRDMDQR